MTNAQHKILDRISEWWETRPARQSSELAGLCEFDLERLARDCGLPTSDFLELARKPPNAAAEMPEMMRALNIDPVEVELEHPAEFRNMQATCALCPSKAKCRRDLGHGRADQNFDSYCGNADALNGMRAEPDLLYE
ncbi:DUF6455 family protein [Rhizobium sp. PAMB 3182]